MCIHSYDDIISIENLLNAWKEFLKGKRNRKDVQEFQLHLMDNIIHLHQDLVNGTYKHALYEAFKISDPKPRNIHKATVRDRLLHRALYRQLYPFFDDTFISDSYSCRKDKGTHKAMIRLQIFYNKVSSNNTKTVWVLKSDIKKFFASIDHQILMSILERRIQDKEVLKLLREIIESFETREGKGLPLGNLISQLLVNVYMNEFDQYMKRALKAKYYIRYADDFVILVRDKSELTEMLQSIGAFLEKELRLELHDHKTSIATFSAGVDFLGWVHFSKHGVLRTVTKRRMFKRIIETERKKETVQSYFGLLRHGDGYGLEEEIHNL